MYVSIYKQSKINELNWKIGIWYCQYHEKKSQILSTGGDIVGDGYDYMIISSIF